MQGWQTTYLGMRKLPREFSAFELRAFFTFSRAEGDLIEARRGDALKPGPLDDAIIRRRVRSGLCWKSFSQASSCAPDASTATRHFGRFLR
ncbi:hypothetical protein SBBP2_550014 [Burkholderiales bacterium]|jgi:hypothetical protein|nr:hypothetical protein SBBP2_550014 [Burkholderiales bacterium]